jgi:hypothetical protein
VSTAGLSRSALLTSFLHSFYYLHSLEINQFPEKLRKLRPRHMKQFVQDQSSRIPETYILGIRTEMGENRTYLSST